MPTKFWTTALLLPALLLGAGCKNHVVFREQGFDKLRQQDFAAAAEDFRAAVDLKPGDYQSQYYLGLSLLRQEQFVAAQTPLEQALILRPDDPAWTPRIADAIAESYYGQDRIETLYAFLDEKIADNNQQTRDYLRKAEFLGRLGDADGQQEALTKAAFFAPLGDAEPYLALAEFYVSVNEVPRAIGSLRQGYFVDPDNAAVKDRLRGLGVVPGPTIADPPPKPAIVE
ncbi:MAG: tetratricopeptide repeat protein [Planctomycetota bacterium]